MHRLFGIGFFVLICSASLFSQGIKGTIRGTVTEAKTGKSLEGVNVVFMDSIQLGTVTDAEGNFVLKNVPPGRQSLEMSSVGYVSQVKTGLLVVSGKTLQVEAKLKTSSVVVSEIVIVESSKHPERLSTRRISMEETKRFAGVFFDPARFAPSFPGVSQTNDQANHLVIRGNSPHGVQWRLNGAEVIAPNHTSNAGTATDRPTLTGGGVSMLSTQMLGTAEFTSGNFDTQFGNATAGVFNLNFRQGNPYKREVTLQAGLIGFDLSMEGPLGNGKNEYSNRSNLTYLLNYRYSTVGLLDLMGVPLGDESIAYQDLAFNLTYEPNASSRLTLFGLSGNSRNDFAGQSVDSLITIGKELYNINYKGQSHIYGLSHYHNFNAKYGLSSSAAWSHTKQGRDKVLSSDAFGDNYTVEDDALSYSILSLNTALWANLSPQSYGRAGLTFTQRSFQVESLFRPGNATGPFEVAAAGRNSNWMAQGFADKTWMRGKINFTAGVHTLYYRLGNNFSFEPRMNLVYSLANAWKMFAGAGRYSQMQTPGTYLTRFETAAGNTPPVQFFPNLNLGLNKSNQYGLGFRRFSRGWNFQMEGYFQQLNQLAIYQDTSRFFTVQNLLDDYVLDSLTNEGRGRNYGIEMSLEKSLSHNFYTLISASWYESDYRGREDNWLPTRYAGKYITALNFGWEKMGGMRASKKQKTWGFNFRATYRGGMRVQPIDLAASKAAQRTIFDASQGFSEQLPAHFRTDFRLIYRVNKRKVTRTLGLDLQNMLNTQNVAYYFYDEFQDAVVTRYQLGIIPNLSYRWEF